MTSGYLESVYGSRARPETNLPTDFRQFNAAIGLPLLPATNKPHELLPYQIDIGEYPGKDIIVCKSNKCGVTEVALRKLAWMATVGDLATYDIILGSSQEELAEENLRRLRSLFLNSQVLRSLVREATLTRIILNDGTRFLTMPSNPAALRSWPRVKAVFLDEAGHIGRLDDTEYFSAASSRLANTNGFMYVVSTPHGQRGFFYDLWTKAETGRVQMKTFKVPYWVGMGVFYAEQFIEKEKQRLGALFSQEYLCDFMPSGRAAIDGDLVDRAGNGDYVVENW